MLNFVDKYGRYHDKPVTDSNPIPSNNGWIYTAYADKLNLTVDKEKLQKCFNECLVTEIPADSSSPHHLIRSPYLPLPPISRDEILGMAALGMLKPEHLNGWNFSPFPLPAFNIVTLVKQLWEIRNKHRNYFWQNALSMVYHVAFSVPLTDRHFILSKWGEFNWFYFIVAKVDSLFKPKNGLGWLKYNRDKEVMLEEFSADHPFKKESQI
jgi:hypothetical protein